MKKNTIFIKQSRTTLEHGTASNIHINSTYMNTKANIANIPVGSYLLQKFLS